MSDQMAGFQSRIKHIADPRNTYYVDPETGTFIPKRISRHQIKTGAKRREVKATFSGVIVSIFLGALALMAARYVRWTYLGMDESGAAETLMYVDAGIATLAVFLVGGLIHHKTLPHMIGQVVGIAVMLVAMHNLVWLMPTEFAMVYGQSYVDQVQSLTTPTSLYVRGATILIPLA